MDQKLECRHQDQWAHFFCMAGSALKYVNSSIRDINNQIRDELNDRKMLQGGIVTDNEGPLWYRGLADGNEEALDPHMKAVLKNRPSRKDRDWPYLYGRRDYSSVFRQGPHD